MRMDLLNPTITATKNFLKASFVFAFIFPMFGLAEYRPAPLAFEDNAGKMAAYPKTYEASRDRFRRWINDQKAANPKSAEFTFKVPSQIDQDLTVDVFYVPAERTTKNLIVFMIGVHGGEAYTASAQVNSFLSGQWRDLEKLSTGLVIVHAMNPYGFKYFRRTTEDNVDLNRNFVSKVESFKDTNTSYEKLQYLLVEPGPVSIFGWHNLSLLPRLLFEMLLTSKSVLRDALVSGQREVPEGVFFGGTKFQPQVSFVRDLIAEKAKPYQKIFFVDFHTGYGKRGTLHLLGAEGLVDKHREYTKSVYTNLQLEVPVQNDVYHTHGDSVSWFSSLFPEKDVAAVCYEMGTTNNQEVLQSFWSLQALRFESQGAFHGYDTEEDYQTARQMSVNNFLPEDSQWRSESLLRATEVLQTALPNFLHDKN